MPNLLRKIYSYLLASQASILTLFLPFLMYSFPKILHNEMFNPYYYVLILLCIALLDYAFRKIPEKNTVILILKVVFIALLFVFLYYSIFIKLPVEWLKKTTGLLLGGKSVFLCVFLLIGGIYFFASYKQKELHSFLNRFYLILTFLFIFGNNWSDRKIDIPDEHLASNSKNSSSPVILIVLDAYSSPNQLNEVYANDSNFAFVSYLQSCQFKVRPDFYSRETNTFKSISSVFNYNLSDNAMFEQAGFGATMNCFERTALIRDMDERKVPFYNYSFLRFGRYDHHKYVYELPNNFVDLFFQFSSLETIYIGTDFFKKINSHYSSNEAFYEYNCELLEQFPLMVEKCKEQKAFLYFHFYMPHLPFYFGNEIYLHENSLDNYYAYWKFTNKKVMDLFHSTPALKNCKVIITGDHGYRADHRVNPFSTFAAFYGFDDADINKVRSVQDLGKLISAYL